MGRVRVAAPERLDEDTIRLAVIQRLPWIKRQREQLQDAERQSEREMVTGESHYVWGQRYRLEGLATSGRLQRRGRRQDALARDARRAPTPTAAVQRLDRWYRAQLKAAVPAADREVGADHRCRVPTRWSVRRMKTKWGSCNRETRTIWFNLELAKKHPRCLEYIVVHEMTHLLERSHGERFTKLMDGFMPDWRTRRDELNGAPLASEAWGVTADNTSLGSGPESKHQRQPHR